MKLTKELVRESLERVAKREGWKVNPVRTCDWCHDSYQTDYAGLDCGLCPDCRHKEDERVN